MPESRHPTRSTWHSGLVGSTGSADGTAHTRVDRAVRWLLWQRSPWSGMWRRTSWWGSANLLVTVLDHGAQRGGRSLERALQAAGRVHGRNLHRERGGFRNHFHDDEGWWALAWLRAHELGGDPRHLDTARGLFEDLTGAWDSAHGGAWWNRDRAYRNTITTQLLMAVAARLHLRDGRAGRELRWAQRAWTWLASCGLRDEEGLFQDGFRQSGRMVGPAWTYNQGVALGGLVDLAKATGDRGLLDTADGLADAALRRLGDEQGVIVEPGGPHASRRDDRQHFKGLFARNLGVLWRSTGRSRHAAALRRNAVAVLGHAQGQRGDRFGFDWAGADGPVTPATQGAALDLLLASETTARG